jgi:hypothetical protein
MGIGSGRSAGYKVCRALEGCSKSVKYQAILISTGRPIRLCASHEVDYRRRGLITDTRRV